MKIRKFNALELLENQLRKIVGGGPDHNETCFDTGVDYFRDDGCTVFEPYTSHNKDDWEECDTNVCNAESNSIANI